jgi:hypothetical protein
VHVARPTHLILLESVCDSTTIVSLGLIFGFLILYAVSRTPWTGGRSVARPLSTHTTTLTQNKLRQTFMLHVGFESTVPVFERPKTVHALASAATVIDKH